MQLVKTIGRYQALPILLITSIAPRKGIRAFLTSLRLSTWAIIRAAFKRQLSRAALCWPSAGYIATFTSGKSLHFTPEEKSAYDAEMLKHNQVMQIYGICQGLGHPGMQQRA